MRKIAFALLLFAAAMHAEDSPLVQAAKASGGPKKKAGKKVITNADVKKSSGKLTVLPGPASGEVKTTTTGPAKSTIEKHEEQKRAAAAAAKRIAASETKVASLERELGRLEQSYYESTDPSYRDTTITARFNQTKRQLDDARKELADARDAHKRATTAPAANPPATKSP